MKEQLRTINALALIILITTSAFTSFAQQRQAAPDDRVRMERERTLQGHEGATPHPDLERAMAEHDAIAHGGTPCTRRFHISRHGNEFRGETGQGCSLFRTGRHRE